MGDSVVLPFLRSQGINELDVLLVSHGDNDHIGGAKSVLLGVKTLQIYSSVPEQLNDHSAETCRAGQQWVWDGVVFKILSPSDGVFDSENDNSCVLMVESDYGNILLTGDIEQTAETWMVGKYSSKLKAEILVAPHHGSNTSSTIPFLQQVNPDIVLIPAGYRNRFRFPHKNVLERYRQVDAEWLNVAEKGAVTVTVNKKGVYREGYRDTSGKYWNK